MHPILFTLPSGQHVYTYGVMLGLALLFGVLMTSRHCKDVEGLGSDRGGNAFLIGAVAGFLGARLTYVAVNLSAMTESGAAWWDVQSGGLIGVGGLVLGGSAAAVYLRARKASLRNFADAGAPALALFVVLGRLGSYLYGSDFGTRLSDSAPAWLQKLGTFPRWQIADLFGPPVFAYHVERYFLGRDAAASYPVHPVQLYEMVLGLLLLILALRWSRQTLPSGAVSVRLMMGLAAGRFVLDYLRDDPDRGQLFGFSVTQLVCLLALPLLWLSYQQLRRAAATRPATTQT